jgi:glycosyltransferase involved in cell wall biosynthesis
MISVILCTHNPHPGRLASTLDGLARQTLARDAWELVVIDNASREPVTVSVDFAFRVVREERLGLTEARLRGIAETSGEAIVFVDDDNVLARDYLAIAQDTLRREPDWGVIGGKSLPSWESPPPDWIAKFWKALALRDLGEITLVAALRDEAGRVCYPPCAPIGAGMVLRRAVAEAYTAAVRARPDNPVSDRRGGALSSGGDNDLVMVALEHDWKIAYVPELQLQHLIPASRCDPGYLGRLHRESHRSWIVTCHLHGMPVPRPIPPALVPVAASRDFVRLQAWKSPEHHIRWMDVRGRNEGRAWLHKQGVR